MVRDGGDDEKDENDENGENGERLAVLGALIGGPGEHGLCSGPFEERQRLWSTIVPGDERSERDVERRADDDREAARRGFVQCLQRLRTGEVRLVLSRKSRVLP